MKAVEYFQKYGQVVFNEAAHGDATHMLEMFKEMYSEIETICKTRNARMDSAKISAVKEVNQKWNKVGDLFTKTYTANPLKRDAIQKVFLKHNPNSESLFAVDKTIKKFQPEQAQKEYDNMNQTSKFLVAMAMLGAMANGDYDEETPVN